MKKPINILTIVVCCTVLYGILISFNSSQVEVQSVCNTGNDLLIEAGDCGSLSGMSFYASDEVVDKGEIAYVSVKAQDFTDVASFSWSIFYDSTVIRLDSAINNDPITGTPTLPNFGAFRYDPTGLRGVNHGSMGFPIKSSLPDIADYPNGTNKVVTVVWSTPTGNPISKQDCSEIFFFCFTAIGKSGEKSPIVFDNSPTRLDVTDGLNVLLSEDDMDQMVNGSVTISGTLSSKQLKSDSDRVRVTPNPFIEEAQAEFYLNKSSQTQIEIYDLEGKRIYQTADYLTGGKQNFQISKSIFPGGGIYLLKITTEEFQISKKLFLIQ